MSYRGSGYRGPQGDRSRSPPRLPDLRPSNANTYDGRHNTGPPPRNADAPRGPRSQFDGPAPRGPPPGGFNTGGPPRTLRDAPPLGSGPRPFREREFTDRRPSPPLRERSPPRKFNETRDFPPPRDIDIRSARRSSRDGPPSAGSNFSDNSPFAGPASSFRGTFGRGRGRGDFEHRGGQRGGRRAFDERPERPDLFRRERSPPPRFGRDLSREGREPERREDRRFERREEDRRPDWLEREREIDRARRDLPSGRSDTRFGGETSSSNAAPHQASQAPPINPERLAIIESSGADPSTRRQSMAQVAPLPREPRRDPPETPSYLNGRAETTANRYGSRGSSPPTQAPPVPAFSFSVAPTSGGNAPPQAPKAALEARPAPTSEDTTQYHDPRPNAEARPNAEERPVPPANAPTAPKAPPVAPKAFHASPPPTAPKAPRALGGDPTAPPSNRLQGVRSMETLAGSNFSNRYDGHPAQLTTLPASPSVARQSLSHQGQPVPPMPPQIPRHADLSAPTGPKATRNINAQSSISPRAPFASPRTDTGGFQPFQEHHVVQRGSTPPPSAPSGPRNRSFSVSPKVSASSIPGIPTGPKAARNPSIGHNRAGDRPLPPQNWVPDRPAGVAPFAPPPGPRFPGHPAHRTWTRLGGPPYGNKPSPAVPAKRDASGEEKERLHPASSSASTNDTRTSQLDSQIRPEDNQQQFGQSEGSTRTREDRMEIDIEPPQRKPAVAEGHSAKQSFFGKTLDRPEDLMDTSSDEDESDDVEDATLLEAKHKRTERELRAQMIDLSAREFRATSPLESIARLARLSVKDIQRHSDPHDDEMDLDVPQPQLIQATGPRNEQPSESGDSPDISTPQGEDSATVVVQETQGVPDVARRFRRPSPEVINLPYLLKGEDVLSIDETDTFQDNIAQFEESMPDVLPLVKDELQAEDDAEALVMASFEDYYRRWREDCDALDRAKEQQEKLERHQSIEPGPEMDAPRGLLANATSDGRRAYKNSSEYEMEQVIKQSEETARIEQEKLDREARKVQADMEKEARLPDQQTAGRIAHSTLIDTNRLREPDALTMVFSYDPPVDDFTESEQQNFVAAFKETPKKWGEIASLLPGRTYKDCIAHYYANKWDGRFRDNRAKKFKGGRRGGRGKGRPTRGSALMADLNRGEELIQASTDSATGRPKRAAAPTTFGEREIEAKTSLVGQSPARKPGPGSKQDGNGEPGAGKPAKKQRRAGEVKPGRKGKSQLAALAAAPTMSPSKPFVQAMHSKDGLHRNQKLEEASLLMNVGNHPGMVHHPDARNFSQETYAMRGNVQVAEDYERSKPSAPSAKQGASSYWSVPEQTDFFKYIAHFGTDFAAIATHMGTKTQTMIKNHYQRQVEGGRSELENQAILANARRDRGEDVGPPPTPTPIIKRKYDNPQSNAPRVIAPQNEAIETDDLLPAHPAPLPKHASPPQYVPKPLYTPSTQSTPVPSHRVVPSPLSASATPTAPPMAAASLPRMGLQHPLGSRVGFLAENRSESRTSMQPTSAFRMAHESSNPSRSQQPTPKLTQTLSNAPDQHYIENLHREQERAMRIQSQNHEVRSEDVSSRPGSMQAPRPHDSPANQHIPQVDRNALMEERAPTPPRGAFTPQSIGRMPTFSSSGTGTGIPSMAAPPLSSFPGRAQFHPSTKPDFMRPGSVATSGPQQHSTTPVPVAASAPATTQTPAPEGPKRSNVLDMLNNEPEETKPAPKRESLTFAPTRVASPAQSSYHSASTPQAVPNVLPPSRRETFGQPSMGQTHYHRSSFGQQGSSTPGPVLKHEPSSGGSASVQHAPQQDWQSRIGQGGQPSPPHGSPLDRDMRPSYFSHRSSMLGPINPARVGSPPPHIMGHSRTSSLSTSQPAQPSREQRNVIGGPPQGPHQSSQGLHSSPYGNPHQPLPFSRPPSQPSNRALHAHNGSLGGDPNMLQRFGSGRDSHRDELIRREGEHRAQQEQEDHFKQRIEAEKQAERQHQYQSQRQNEQRFQEQEMERQRLQQQAFSRGPPPPMPQGFTAPFGPTQHRLQQHQQPMGGLRDMSFREAEALQQEEQHRRMHQQQQQHQDNERRRQEQQLQQPPPPPFPRDRDQQGDFRRRPPYAAYPPPSQQRRL